MFHPQILAAFFILLFTVAEVEAQWYGGRPYYGGGYYPYGGGYPTTAASANAYGMSELVRASGEASVNYSQAAINNQQANSLYIQNRRAWNDAYWSMKRRCQSEIAEDRGKAKVTRDKYLQEEREAAQARALQTRAELNAYTGALTWPDVLNEPDYAASKAKMDQLLELWAQAPHTPGLTQEIADLATDMKGQLRKNISEYSPNAYIQARQFLEKLHQNMSL